MATEEDRQNIRAVQSQLDGLAQSLAHWQGTMNERVEAMREDNKELRGQVSELSSLVRETYAKVTNGLSHRVERLEDESGEYVTKDELNNAANSLRRALEEDRKARDQRDADRDKVWRRGIAIIGTLLTAATVVAMYLSVI
jgi:DNA repair exonuclease SbcCD ATPase subunit